MNIVIIEDERLVAEDLQSSILQLLDSPANIIQLRSVKEAIAYFEGSHKVDLVFSDIQLGDGLSFEIFMKVATTAPIIFCTAYDQYAMEAFSANGIDYILKPFTSETLERALNKYGHLKQQFSGGGYEQLMEILTNREKQVVSSILVYYQDKIMPIKLSEIALFYLENEVTHIVSFDGKRHYPNKSLEELEKIIGQTFFRANRQYLVSRKVVRDVSSFFSRKLSLNLTINFEEKIMVSKVKAPLFLEWLSKAD
ncbi:LytTR family DNA-binding domain-containing protein [Pedobacter psychrodurus]|uniref:LytR/AlgR family response regulator transcription factor n=1 Tax=Pedobacter psychrodurus TaxID=2530456 RepID=UPI00292E9615|nr:LytTR family DNA-binding domain-containing protein [Pedobacter psychrodurus]